LHQHSGQQMQQPSSSAWPARLDGEGRRSHDEGRQGKARDEKELEVGVRRDGLCNDETSGPDEDENGRNGEAKQGGRGSSSRLWNERQDHMRWPVGVHEDCVACNPTAEPRTLRRAGIRVDVEMREVAG
jgi:hypothetical protein